MRPVEKNSQNGQPAEGIGPVSGVDEVRDFEDLVARYDRKLYNLVVRLVGNRDDAADLTQEAFYRAFRAWDTFEGRAHPYTWLSRIAVNLCRNRVRNQARRPEEPLEPDEHPDETAVPEKAAQKAEMSARVRAAIDSLPLDYRIVAVLRDLQGLTYQEVADATGLSTDVVKTRLARARGMLRVKLEGYV